ncbi:MAG: hypothetical protein HN919_10565 [Verrucomicrobia bacterium]|jgi:hypothetical protein|nr:hypothetical protein [Verrucomicrobiota bacterium]MBT7066735.1 hypothetical protein [Verrucomicrobiota bacterium]MBT7701657.1 hypothetical protein [Verrucomicrobiota bacterium]
MKSVYPIGTTLYKPAACSGGYNLIGASGSVKLVNMNGEVVHTWPVDPEGKKGFIHRARLLPNGQLMLLFGGKDIAGHVAEFDWDGTEAWSYTPANGAHHDFWPTDRGSVFLLCCIPVPPEYAATITDPQRREGGVSGDELIEVSREGEVIWRWLQHEHMDVNQCNQIPANLNWMGGAGNNTVADWTHTNTIQELPENQWYDGGDARFKPGNILQSLRQLDTISIIDRDSGEVVWAYTGDYNGGLSGQHEPHMIEKGLPGAGHIIVFDNGASPLVDLAHCGCSYVLEINPSDNSLVWVYDDAHRFFARFTANCQRLPNGNTLILESLCRRLFEVTPEKEIVWEHVLTDPAQRVYRYPYDYCAAFQSLGEQVERSVTPPAELRIEPDA